MAIKRLLTANVSRLARDLIYLVSVKRFIAPRCTMKRFIVLLVLSTCFVSAPVFADYLPEDTEAESTIPTQERVKAFLESDRYLLSRLELRELTEDVVGDLVVIAKDHSVRTQTRARAIQGLGLYPDDARSGEVVGELFNDSRPGEKLFELLLVTHVQVNGSSATESVIHYLYHDDPGVRESVVVALGRFGGQMAFELLKARKVTETDPAVKATISSYVD